MGSLNKAPALGFPRLAAAFGCLALLAACASSPPPATSSSKPPTSGRYALEHDVPMLEPFDISRVRPVIPRPEPRTAAGNKSPYTVNGVTYRVMATEEGYSATGLASWYGRKFHGHATSNGEIYDMFQLSAAHRSLPIPSYVKVTNLANGRELVVRVNDRGPFHADRVIDLSYAAATLLGYSGQGTARVRIEAILPSRQGPTLIANNGWWLQGGSPATLAVAPVATPPPTTVAALQPPPVASAPGQGDYLQVGAFSSLESARGLVSKLAALTGLPARIHSEPDARSAAGLHRVRLGPLNESVDLESLIRTIVDANLGTPFRVSR